MYFVGKDVDYTIIIGGITGIALAFIAQIFIVYQKNKRKKEKKDNIPEVDERVINNMVRFLPIPLKVLFIWRLLVLEIYILKIVNFIGNILY